MRKHHRNTGILVVLAAIVLYFGFFFSFAAHAQSNVADQAKAIVAQHVTAQLGFDPDTLNKITHTHYFEISPAGEFDSKEKMLGFYTKKGTSPTPELQFSEWGIREFTSTTVASVRLNYKMQVGEQTRQFSMRASYVLCPEAGVFKLCAAHYTPIRER